ncbi:MAG: HAMP domain-containing histidine kinase [Acidobacteria bacterium]|nr:HAMP domain-containing histidine kinase [Acidobacteriota bacterium]
MAQSPTIEQSSKAGKSLPTSIVTGLLDILDRPLLVAERSGRIVMSNVRAQHCMESHGFPAPSRINLFSDLLHLESAGVMGQLETGEHEISLPVECPQGQTVRASIRWMPEPDWLVVLVEPPLDLAGPSVDSDMKARVQELVEEREITYRNLLAAYLRLQEVNRQKTVFLASAAHELKTPLAVMKGYYDLLLSPSLGKLNEKQRDIVQESKDSCDRLVRLVSMFLNYSALESGKLVLHIRENDLRDCLNELVTRWSDAFHRKQVRLESHLEITLSTFKFDYQKVQQAAANLLDNALKHTPQNGAVVMRAQPHFWERRVAEMISNTDRRRGHEGEANSVQISVSDTGPGLASEFHQEIFEDFVRVDRSSSGMGLGLAIAKRLVQAHRGKIWVDSEQGRGCTFHILLPTDTQ